MRSAEMRDQFNALNDRINGVLKLPDYRGVAAPVAGQLAYDPSDSCLMFYDGSGWQAVHAS
jgi:hypothetical protein